ncbi:pyridoxine 5'-phosphate synthase [bacterium]|nr:pyridoxine 5'-phosphate synthase [bacterium]
MIALSVNINKIGTLRNARGGIIPNVIHGSAASRLRELRSHLFPIK